MQKYQDTLTALNIRFFLAKFKSPLHLKSITQRQDILRTPLGLTFKQEELDAEYDQLHLVGCIDTENPSS
jgi:hypothetical protein